VSRAAIITADDFGLAAEVNDAVEHAHRQGVLTAASLMVGERHVEQAVAIARRNPALAVGLHLTLTDGAPVLPPERIPALVRPDGRFRDDMARLGLELAVSRGARAQLRAEIAAQFAAFAATGLRCDHLNAHKHFHLHPVIAQAAFAAARDAGIRCVRIPWERSTSGFAVSPMIAWLRRLARHYSLTAPDRVVGLAWSGAFTAERLAGALAKAAPGVTEFYLHPAAAGGFPGAAPGAHYTAELAALLDPRVRDAAARLRTGGYTTLLRGTAASVAPR